MTLRRTKLPALMAPLLGAALLLAEPAAADNTVTDAVGTAQASAVSAAPTVTAEGTSDAVEATLPVTVGTGGDNTASQSVGTAQAGGANEADSSLATAQVSHLGTRPSADVRASAVRARVGSPAATRQGSNGARRSAATVQVGGDRADGSFGRVVAGSPTAEPDVVVTRAPGSPSGVVSRGLAPTQRAAALRPAVSDNSRVAAEPDVNLGAAHVRMQLLNVEPAFLLAADPLARLTVGGRMAVTPPAGSAERSFGTVQAGGVLVAPTLGATTPFGEVGIGGRAIEIAGGGNQASDSVGTVQVGGGNEASGSRGTAQVGGVNIGPETTLRNTPLGNLTLRTPLTIGGPGGNRADGSTGTAQVGGGNRAGGSFMTFQVGSSSGGTGPGAETTAGTSASALSASGTAGGGTPTAGGSAPAPGSVEASRLATTGRPGPTVLGSQGRGGVAPDGEAISTEGAMLAADTPRVAAQGGELPFTGFPLWVAGLLGLGLATLGAGLLRAAR